MWIQTKLVTYSRKFCEATMEDLLLFTPAKRTHMTKSYGLLKALIKWTKNKS